MPAFRREEYACNALQLRQVKYFWPIPRQEVCRGQLGATREAALRHRTQKTPVFFNTEVLLTLMRGVGKGMRVGAASRSGVTYLFHYVTGSRLEIHRDIQEI